MDYIDCIDHIDCIDWMAVKSNLYIVPVYQWQLARRSALTSAAWLNAAMQRHVVAQQLID
jgi:hypothetical protein